jgi:adenylyltransferase/sulfurtransferase
MMPQISEEGQKKLKNARVAVIGVGGLGCASSIYLAAAGVGTIKLVDFDIVQPSDLNRQILYYARDTGKAKVNIAAERLLKLNPLISIAAVNKKIDGDNVAEIIGDVDIVIDGLDTMAARMIVNAGCVNKQIPFICGGVSRLRGMVTTVIPGKTPCLACFYDEGSGGKGVIGPAAAITANMQVLEAVKLLVGLRPSLAGRLLKLNSDEMKFSMLEISRNPGCKVCRSPESKPNK